MIDLLLNLPLNLSIKSLLDANDNKGKMLRRGLRCEPLCSFAFFSYHREDRIANIMAFAFLAISPCCLRRNGILSNAFSLLCFIHDILTDLRKSESPTKPHFCIIYVPQFRSSSL